jgi:hypothetical protein
VKHADFHIDISCLGAILLPRNRFSTMKIEWLAIWVHFVWSGSTIMICCLVTWWKIGAVTGAITTSSQRRAGQGIHSSKMRRRLLSIAGLISVCLLLNVVSTIVTSAKLEEWTRTTELTLVCTIKETWSSRAWDAYGLTEDNIVEVCSGEEIISANTNCIGGCYWHPGVSYKYLTCANSELGLDDRAAVKALVDKDDWDKNPPPYCDCPCSRFVEIKRPRYRCNLHDIVYKRAWNDPIVIHTAGNSVAMLTLSHVAQSMVVVIVGLSMGFRSVSVSATKHNRYFLMVSCNPLYSFPLLLFVLDRKTNVDIWRKFYRVHVSTRHTAVGTMRLADLGASSGMLSCVDIDFLSVQNHKSVYSVSSIHAQWCPQIACSKKSK